MGVATIVHWNKFVHGNVAFWLWAGLYFTPPFLVFTVWALERRNGSPKATDDVRIGKLTAMVIGVSGIAAAATSLFLFVFPRTAIGYLGVMATTTCLSAMTCRHGKVRRCG